MAGRDPRPGTRRTSETTAGQQADPCSGVPLTHAVAVAAAGVVACVVGAGDDVGQSHDVAGPGLAATCRGRAPFCDGDPDLPPGDPADPGLPPPWSTLRSQW